jgi:hypothetical protein
MDAEMKALTTVAVMAMAIVVLNNLSRIMISLLIFPPARETLWPRSFSSEFDN